MGWKQDAAAGGGVINDLASHAVDLADWLAGPLAEVQAESRILYPERPDGRGGKAVVEAEDAVAILARLRDGGLGVIEASKIATGSNDELRVEIHGDRGALRFNSMEPNGLEAYSLADPEEPIGGTRGWRRIDTVNRLPKPAGWPGPKFTVGWLQTHVHCLNNFVSAAAEGRQTRPSLADGVRLDYLLEEIRRSAKERAWRPIAEETPC
jgi:predicted dehydrogenase